MDNIVKLKFLRITTSGIFIVSGLGHLIRPETIKSKLTTSWMGNIINSVSIINELIVLSGLPLLFFGIMLLINKKVKLSSAILGVNVLIISLVTHLNVNSIGPLFKNIVIIGALYTLYIQEINKRVL